MFPSIRKGPVECCDLPYQLDIKCDGPLVGLIRHGFTHAADAESCSWIPDAVRVEVNGLENASRQKYPGSGSSKPTARCNNEPCRQHFF